MNKISKVLVVVVCLLASGGFAYFQAQSAPDLVAATETFLKSLDAQQAAMAQFDFPDEERLNWNFIPMERQGLTLKDMAPHQQALAHSMMSAVLGYRGVMKATTIMSLEDVLRQIEGPTGRFARDPELYYISVFGEPSTEGTWGWRLEGHHLSVNVTMTDGRIVASSPAFMGSNPAEVREGPRTGLRALGAEEDLGRALFTALDAGQQAQALLEGAAPRDIVTGNSRRAMLEGDPAGIAASDLNSAQTAMLRSLIREYTDRMAPEVVAGVLERIDDASFGALHFAWAGTADIGAPHYYRVQGPTFLIEYDNTQNGANHVHSVFRDLTEDWGGDALLAHYQAFHSTAAAD